MRHMNRVQPREDAKLNRRRIVDAAREVFRERGVAAEMREIAERSGLAVGTIYRNYPSKDDLIIALLDDALADLTVTSDAGSEMDELQLLLSRAIELAARYGWLIEAYLGHQVSDRCREAMKRKSLEFDLAKKYRVLLNRGIDTGQFRTGIDVERTTTLLLGVSSPWVCQPLLEKETPEEIASNVIHVLLAGIDGKVRG